MTEDKKQIGLTAAGQAAIQSLMEQKLFDTESDAYKVGIAYAIAAGLKSETAPSVVIAPNSTRSVASTTMDGFEILLVH